MGAAATAAAVAGGIGAAGSVASSLIGSSSARGSAQQATDTQQQALLAEQAMAQPYATAGQIAESELGAELQAGALGQPAPTDLTAIANMPGYQFTLRQGLQATQNAAAAQGLGVSGPALLGAANYATGLAQSNFQQYFNDYWANQNNRFNMLSNLVGIGANAAVGAGSNVANTASGIANAQLAQGAATASGFTGAGNALSSFTSSPAFQNLLMGKSGGSAVVTPDPQIAAAEATSPYPGTFYGVPTNA